jgi:hypothetical protein
MTDTNVIMGLLALAITVLGGILKFTNGRISDLEKTYIAERGSFRSEMQTLISAQNLTIREIAGDVRQLTRDSNDQHDKMAERLSHMATRDDVRQDIAASEARIMVMLRKPVGDR